jgi:putative redox protein
MLQHEQLASNASMLDLHIATPATTPTHALILVHGLPRAMGQGRLAASLLPELAEHLANESGWLVATGTLSGVGSSTGSFTPTQWRHDLATIVNRIGETSLTLTMAGFGVGGALALRHASDDERIRGVATFATPAHLAPWAGTPASFYQAVQEAGVVTNVEDLPDPQVLYDGVLAIDPLAAIAVIPPRRLLIGHGSDDLEIPASDARDLVAAAEGRAELRIIQSAGHQLRADPRMVATLLGWLDRY